jgi:hypothetical protein
MQFQSKNVEGCCNGARSFTVPPQDPTTIDYQIGSAVRAFSINPQFEFSVVDWGVSHVVVFQCLYLFFAVWTGLTHDFGISWPGSIWRWKPTDGRLKNT